MTLPPWQNSLTFTKPPLIAGPALTSQCIKPGDASAIIPCHERHETTMENPGFSQASLTQPYVPARADTHHNGTHQTPNNGRPNYVPLRTTPQLVIASQEMLEVRMDGSARTFR